MRKKLKNTYSALFAFMLPVFAMTTANADQINGNDNFYYRQNGSEVSISLAGSISTEDGGNIISAFYDDGVLINMQTINIPSSIKELSLKTQTFSLPYAPENLSVKVFGWDSLDGISPLCTAAKLSNVPKNAEIMRGMITGSYKDGICDKNEVRIENFDDGNIYWADILGASGILNHSFETTDFYYIENKDGDMEILSYSPVAHNDYAYIEYGEKLTLSDGVLNNMPLSDDVRLIINGIETENGYDSPFFQRYLEKYSAECYRPQNSKITLIDNDLEESDGSFDTIKIDYFDTATVDSIIEVNGTKRLLFYEVSENINNSCLDINLKDDTISYNITNINGVELSPNDIKDGDKIYIAFKPDNFRYSSFYNIIVDTTRTSEQSGTNDFIINSALGSIFYNTNNAVLSGNIAITSNGVCESYNTVIEAKKNNEVIYTKEFKVPGAASKITLDEVLECDTPDKVLITFKNNNDSLYDPIEVPIFDSDSELYTVYGRITGIENSYVSFQIEQSDNISTGSIRAIPENSAWGFNYYNIYVEAKLSKENDNYKIISINPYDTTITDDMEADFFADIQDTRFEVYESPESFSTVSYRLSNDAKLIINGVEAASGNELEAACKQYIENSPSSIFRLIDTPQPGSLSSDGYYDIISVDYYVTAKVKDITESSITFDDISCDDILPILLDNANIICNAYTSVGKPMNIKDIKPNDVFSIAYDVTKGFNNSTFYNIYVTSKKLIGTVEEMYTYNNKSYYVIDGKTYTFAYGMEDTLLLGEQYKLYLDKFGNIASKIIAINTENIAIVDRFFTSAGDRKVRLILSNGSWVSYTLKPNGDQTGLSSVMDTNTTYPLISQNEIIEETIRDQRLIKTTDRFVRFKVNGFDEVSLYKLDDINIVTDYYDNENHTIGSANLANDVTLINAAEYAQCSEYNFTSIDYVRRISEDEIIPNLKYITVLLGKNDENKYCMAAFLSWSDGYTINSKLSVVAAPVSKVITDCECIKIPIYNGDKIEYLYTEDTFIGSDLQPGDAFIYSTDFNNRVDEICILLSGIDENTTAKDLLEQCGVIDTGDIYFKGCGSNKQPEFILAPVIKKYQYALELATDIDKTTYLSDDCGEIYSYAPNVAVYEVQYTRKGNLIKPINPPSITYSAITSAGKEDYKINWLSENNLPAFALIRLYDGDVQEVYSIPLAD